MAQLICEYEQPHKCGGRIRKCDLYTGEASSFYIERINLCQEGIDHLKCHEFQIIPVVEKIEDIPVIKHEIKTV